MSDAVGKDVVVERSCSSIPSPLSVADPLRAYPRKLASKLRLELVTRRQMPLVYARRRYSEALRRAATVGLDNGFPGGCLTEDGEFYLDVRGFAIYYNIRHPGLTPGDGQSLDSPAGRQSTPLEQFVLDSVPEDGVYVDVGANNGFFYALQVARRCPRAVIFAFEPDPQILPHLERNVRRNGFADQIEIVPAALSDVPGRSRLTVGMGASGFLLTRDDPQPGVEVPVTTLDTFAEERGLERIDVIKVDIEGLEERMLRGSRQVLLHFRPILILELIDAHLRRSGSSRTRVQRLLEDVGYSIQPVAGSNDAVARPERP
jgi:FkbM family methyltransferase